MLYEDDQGSELYTVSRFQIQYHENSIFVRSLWLINSQSFAFGIYSGTILFMSPDPKLHTKAQILHATLPFIGFVFTLFTLIDIVTSVVEMHKLNENYKAQNNNHAQELDFPLLNGTLADRFLQQFSSVASSLLFLAVWTLLIIYDHHLFGAAWK